MFALATQLISGERLCGCRLDHDLTVLQAGLLHQTLLRQILRSTCHHVSDAQLKWPQLQGDDPR